MKTPIRRRAAGALAAVAMAGASLVAAAPAHAAWGTTYNLSIQVTYNGLDLGRADGWVQFDDGGSAFHYALTICRQSSYSYPSLQVAVNAGFVGGTWQQTTLEYLSPYGSTVAPRHPPATATPPRSPARTRTTTSPTSSSSSTAAPSPPTARTPLSAASTSGPTLTKRAPGENQGEPQR